MTEVRVFVVLMFVFSFGAVAFIVTKLT